MAYRRYTQAISIPLTFRSLYAPFSFFFLCIEAFIGRYDRNTCLFLFPGPYVRKEEAVRGLVTEVEQKYGEISGKEKNLRFMTVILCTCVL